MVVVSKESGPWVFEEAQQLIDSQSVMIPIVLSKGPKPLTDLIGSFRSVDVTSAPKGEQARHAAEATASLLKLQKLL